LIKINKRIIEENNYICYSHRIIFTVSLLFKLQNTPSKNSSWWWIKSTYPEKDGQTMHLVSKVRNSNKSSPRKREEIFQRIAPKQ